VTFGFRLAVGGAALEAAPPRPANAATCLSRSIHPRQWFPMTQRILQVAHRVARLAGGFAAGIVVLGLLVAPAYGADPKAEAEHSAAGHDGHGHDDHGHGHGPEIGHNPPAGVSQKDFESPAWFQTDLALWSFAVFLLLMFLLTKFAWKPIMEGLDKREQGIADTIAATKAANEEAKSMLASYERRLAEAADEVRGMLEEARRDAEATKTAIVAEARKAADEEQARAKREIGLATDDALSRIAERAGELAVDVAGKFLRQKLSADDQQQMIRDSVAAIRSTPSVN
jgi:F-type H+-transporting ATPase subunit b